MKLNKKRIELLISALDAMSDAYGDDIAEQGGEEAARTKPELRQQIKDLEIIDEMMLELQLPRQKPSAYATQQKAANLIEDFECSGHNSRWDVVRAYLREAFIRGRNNG